MALAVDTTVDAAAADFLALSKEFAKFEEQNKTYVSHLDAVYTSQSKNLKDLSHHKYRLAQISESLKKLKDLSPDEKVILENLKIELAQRKAQLNDIAGTLPAKNNIYLRIVLGNVNVSLLSKAERFKYKDEYERFKLVVTVISTIWSFCNLFLFEHRVMDAAFHFLLVWYYCTLTIREGILRMNGSKIQPWWVAHHYISTFQAGVLVTWPDTVIYHAFRNQFFYFSLYLGLVQMLQYRYQHGQLYKLKALGERSSMELTVEGFHSWMWRGLGFLLPFLFGGYFLQLYNAYTLWNLSKDPRCHEWQVGICAIVFFVLFLGNTVTTLIVVKRKFQQGLRTEAEKVTKYKST
ncbi:Transmembrane protein 120-like protein [Hypsibius exemplaris]|uniref:Transmembrane protein 120-like protein n=1 Tax=Hypsibius exemplaris TaxID=2072580 RepID=A0A1W0WQP9_HYPEX|nr:Transmembrane protein 120-like protein [Hypsibius exemplaris]